MHKLLIAIDALPINPGKSGAVGAVRNMIQLTPKIDASVELNMFWTKKQFEYYKKFYPLDKSKYPISHIVPVPMESRILRIGAQNCIVPISCYHFKIDVHFSMNPEPFFKMNNIAEVFKVVDLQFYDVPDEFGRMKTKYRKILGHRKVHRSELVIANSEYTKNQIRKYYKVNSDKIKVVYEAVDHNIFNTNDDAISTKEVLKKRFGIEKPYIIYVSSFRPYKNHIYLLRAFKKLKKSGSPHELLLIGNDIGGYRSIVVREIENLGLRKYVHLNNYIHHWDLKILYRSASLAVYPSSFETFGIPPLESMACGVPVMVSNKSAVPEVSGGGASIVDPFDEDNMAYEMNKILNNVNESNALIKKGLSWCKRYSWQNNISKTLELIKKIAV